MAFKVGLDIGHGKDTYPKTGGKGVPGMAEFSFNQAIMKVAQPILEDHGVEVVKAQPFDANDVSLRSRTNKYNAEDCDIVMSGHADANGNEDAYGFWGFYWHTSEQGKKLADIWAENLKNETGTRYRGNQESKRGAWTNFHMVRETKMPTVLMEHGFMTNAADLKRLKSREFREQCGIAIAKTVCEYAGIQYKGSKVKGTSTSKQGFANLHPDWWMKKGDDIKEVQELLQEVGINPGPVDGIFGQKTLDAVRQFQEDHNISSPAGDYYGVPGPSTTAKLEKEAKPVGKMVVVTYDGNLNVRDKATWDAQDVVGQVQQGEAFTIVDELKVDGTRMYKLKSGLYITGHEHYVRVK